MRVIPTKPPFFKAPWKIGRALPPQAFGQRQQSDDQRGDQQSARLVRLEVAQPALLAEATQDLNQEAARLMRALKTTNIDTKKLMSRTSQAEAVGGPLIPIDSAELGDDAFPRASPKPPARCRNFTISSRLSEPAADHAHRHRRHEQRLRRPLDPFNEQLAFHSGVDFSAPKGADVHSTAAGIVVFAGRAAPTATPSRLTTASAFAPATAICPKSGAGGERGGHQHAHRPHRLDRAQHRTACHYEIWFDQSVKDPSSFIRRGTMFSKSKEPETAATAQTSSQPKRPTRNGVPSIISAELSVRGTLVSAGDIQVDGRVDGDIRATSLVVGEKATILGDIYAEEATVRGRVEGSIRARKVHLCATCQVEGNILHEALSVEAGAFLRGNCRHSDNPLADAPAHRAGAAQTGRRGLPRTSVGIAASAKPAEPSAFKARPLEHAAKGGSTAMANTLASPEVAALLTRLFAQADAGDPLILQTIQKEADARFGGQRYHPTLEPLFDKALMPVPPEVGTVPFTCSRAPSSPRSSSKSAPRTACPRSISPLP
jgi:cytoskeletal protein CcmA (bactofilin family)